MRTTVDLTPDQHRRAKALAEERGTSLSSVLAELVSRGLSHHGDPLVIRTDSRSGFPVVSIGRRITSAEVADELNDE